jgi:hypothetical protein
VGSRRVVQSGAIGRRKKPDAKIAFQPFQHDLRASTYREIRIPDTMSGMCCSAHSRLPIGQRPLADKNWSMRVAHDAADYWSAGVTEPHIVVGNGHLRRRQDHVPAVGVEAASLLGAPGGTRRQPLTGDTRRRPALIRYVHPTTPAMWPSCPLLPQTVPH